MSEEVSVFLQAVDEKKGLQTAAMDYGVLPAVARKRTFL